MSTSVRGIARGVIVLDLRTTDPEKEARHKVDALHMAPTGSTAIVTVGDRTPNLAVTDLLREHLTRLDVQVHADDPETLALWLGDLTVTGWW